MHITQERRRYAVTKGLTSKQALETRLALEKAARVRRRQRLLRVEVARRQDSSSGCRTTTTGRRAERRTRSVTLPMMSR